MGFFRQIHEVPTFNSRSEAFDFMLAERIKRGDDYAEAADKADRFAEIIAKNKNLPATTPKPKNGIEKVVGYVEQVALIKKEHPEVWDLVIGGIGGLVSGFIVKKEDSADETPQVADIDFEKIE